MPRALWLYLGAFALVVQSLGATLWWALLWLAPPIRALFRPSSAPDAVLLAFFLPDVLLFIGAAMWAAYRLIADTRRALLPLALHVGAATYAALYCVLQFVLTGEALLAVLFMVPSMLLGWALLWKLSSSI